MTASPAHRQPAGIPTGGQFAQQSRGESGISLVGAKTAAENAVDQAYAAGIAEGLRRAQGMQPLDRDGTVLDLTDYDLSAAPAQPMSADPWSDPVPEPETGTHVDLSAIDLSALPEPEIQCLGCQGATTVVDWQTSAPGPGYHQKICPDCNGHGSHPATVPGQDTVEVPSFGVLHRRRDGVYPGTPSMIRMEASRPLTDAEVQRTAQLLGYGYRASVRGESLDDPIRDSARSFIVFADTTKSSSDDLGVALEEFEDNLPGLLADGSPMRTTNRAGTGTKGTRLVDGLGDPDLCFEIYYDDVIPSI